jgi:hypothetical protein
MAKVSKVPAAVLSSREVLHPSSVRGVVIERVETVRGDDGHLYEVDYWVQSETGQLVRIDARLV